MGLEIEKSFLNKTVEIEKAIQPVAANRSGNSFVSIHEPWAGAWERNQEITVKEVYHNDVLFACLTKIANDISKISINIVRRETKLRTTPIEHYCDELLKRPNSYQNRQQFIEKWMLNKLKTGNAYILKDFDSIGQVKALYVLNSDLVTPLIADNGQVFYQISYGDRLTGKQEQTETIPSRYIIHDRFNCIDHDLVGVSPIAACMIPTKHALRIQQHSERFFANSARPGGLLTVPRDIKEEDVKKLGEDFHKKFSGSGTGKIAVLGDGAKWSSIDTVSAIDSQLVEQYKMSAEAICRVFHMPAHKVEVGAKPTGGSIESEQQGYLDSTLHTHIESIQLCLAQGLGLEKGIEVQFDVSSDYLRMDADTRSKFTSSLTKAGIMTLNEARQYENLEPLPYGDTVYMQQQNYSLEDINRRSQKEDPFETNTSANNKSISEAVNTNNNNTSQADEDAETHKALSLLFQKDLF